MRPGRGRRVLVYTAALLLSPLPVMPFEPGTREFALALVPCGAALSLASLYVFRGERRRGGPPPLLRFKLLASSLITLLFGAALVVGSLIYLARR